MKYIDAEKLKRLVGELKERAKRNRCDSWGIVPDALEEVEGFITSLQQEHPSLPSNIDEAAEEYSENILANNEDLQDAIEDAFKEGAKWMARQGETIEGEVVMDINNNLAITAKGFSGKEAVFGDKVIVQIRKKQ